jgi:hypothetical protein
MSESERAQRYNAVKTGGIFGDEDVSSMPKKSEPMIQEVTQEEADEPKTYEITE